MRLGTLQTSAGPRAVALQEAGLLELGGSLRELLAGGPDALRRAAEGSGPRQPFEPSRLPPAIPDPGKVLCVGRNYADHAAELGNLVADEHPEIFMRAR